MRKRKLSPACLLNGQKPLSAPEHKLKHWLFLAFQPARFHTKTTPLASWGTKGSAEYECRPLSHREVLQRLASIVSRNLLLGQNV